MAYCTSCGAQMEDRARFCTACGATTGVAADAGSTPAAVPPAASGGGSGLLRIILIAVGIVVLLGGVVTVAGLFVAYRMAKNVTVTEGPSGTRVETPFGTVETSDSEAVARDMGVPIYPGAEPVEGGSSVRMGNWTARTAVFDTSDSPNDVANFYRERFPNARVSVNQPEQHVFMIGRGHEMTTIAIAEHGSGSRITISRMGGEEEDAQE